MYKRPRENDDNASKNARKVRRKEKQEVVLKVPRHTKDAVAVGASDTAPSDGNADGIFKNLSIFILQAGGLTKARCEIFRKQILKHGGVYEIKRTPNITHIIIDDKIDKEKFCKIIKENFPQPNVRIVRSLWLSMCIKQNELISTGSFELNIKTTNVKEKEVPGALPETPGDQGSNCEIQEKGQSGKVSHKDLPVTSPGNRYKNKVDVENRDDQGDAGSDYVPSDEEEDYRHRHSEEEASTSETPFIKKLPKGNWVCAQSSTNKKTNVNQNITEKLEKLAKTYESTNDRWRAMTYQKAVAALKKYDKEITSWEEAKAIPGIGASLADKIWEIIESGELRKLNELSSADDIATLNLFTNIWGAGPTTARAWVQQGLRSLEDLKTKGNLNRQQKIGLQYYDELLDRMPRTEAAEIEATVKEAALVIQPGLIAMACGSYRRGKMTCGDVDVLITHPDGHSHKGVFNKLLTKLKDQGFLTDDLVTHEEVGNQKKYMGVCKLPGAGRKHRRLDIIVVPHSEFACALMYFTGSAHFNRSMRNLASKMGMSLNEHSLNTGVVRKHGEKVFKGTPLSTPTEEAIFEHFGLPYRPPEERDH